MLNHDTRHDDAAIQRRAGAWSDGVTVTLHHGDCLEFMRTLPAGSVDAVVTDPPYGIGYNPQQFKKWDGSDSSFQRIADAQAQPALIGGAA